MRVTAADLLGLAAPPGALTAAGLRSNVDVALRWVAAWLGDVGTIATHT